MYKENDTLKNIYKCMNMTCFPKIHNLCFMLANTDRCLTKVPRKGRHSSIESLPADTINHFVSFKFVIGFIYLFL